jgi:hypothetical protein
MISTSQKELPDQLRKAVREVLNDCLNSHFKPDEFQELRVNILALRGEVSQGRQNAIEYIGENKLLTSGTSTLLETIVPVRNEEFVSSIRMESSRNFQVSEPSKSSNERLEEMFQQIERLKTKIPQRVTTDARISNGQSRLDGRVHRRLQRWWAEPDSRLLWIQEPPYTKVSSTVASVCSAAKQSGIPVIEVSCRRSFDNDGAEVGHLDLFMMAIYSMIYQLIRNALNNFLNSRIDIATQTLEALDGTPTSIPLALALIKDLITMDTPPQILVISGFQNLEDLTNATLTRYILELLQIVYPDPLGGPKPNIKSLILTPGKSLTLLGAVKQTEILDATIAAQKHYLPLSFALPETKDKD